MCPACVRPPAGCKGKGKGKSRSFISDDDGKEEENEEGREEEEQEEEIDGEKTHKSSSKMPTVGEGREVGADEDDGHGGLKPGVVLRITLKNCMCHRFFTARLGK